MYFLDWYFGFFAENAGLRILLFAAVACLIAVSVLSLLLKSKAAFFSLTVCMACCLNLALLFYERNLQAAIVCDLSVGIFACLCFIGVQSAFWASRKRAEKRRERAEILRQLEYTLPDKDNGYVRARLHTALQCAPRNEKPTKEEFPVLRLEYVRKLLTSVRNAPLTGTERLETEDMAKLFTAYISKNKWTAEDVRVINELFARLLKLSAKYAV